MAFSGELADYPLAELLFFLSSKGRSGWLTLRNGSSEVTFTLRNGRVIAAASNDVRTRLGQQLLAGGVINQAQLEQALALQRRIHPKPALGEVLVSSGIVSQEQLRQVLRQQVAELLFQILIQPGGTFHFERGLPDLRGIDMDIVVEHVVLHAIRRADEWAYQRLATAPIAIAPQVTPDLLEGHLQNEWPIIEALLDDASTVDEITRITGMPETAVLESLLRLQAGGIIYVVPEDAAPRLALVGD